MTEIDLIPDEKDFEVLEDEKVVLMDLEGTLTAEDMYVPRDPNPEHVYRVFDGEEFEVRTNLGYWSGLHLLAGEKPAEYFKRVDRWRNGQITRDEFEEKNIDLMNKLIGRTDKNSAEEVIEWYNREFLNLRDGSKELVELFKEQGYTTGIISHTSQSLSVRAAEELGIDFVVPTWIFETEYGEFSYVKKTKYAEDKSVIVDELKQNGVKDISFIGNGKNDISIAEEADNSYMIENKDGLRYKDIDAGTGGFEEVLEMIKTDLGGEK